MSSITKTNKNNSSQCGDSSNSVNKKRKAGVVLLVVTIILIASFLFLNLNNQDAPVTVNELYDAMIDRNNDGIISQEDLPIAWHSYTIGDKVVVRDMINTPVFESDQNYTILILVEYTGVHEGGGGIINAVVPGNALDIYHQGDFITVETRMIEYEDGSVIPGDWTFIE